MMRFKETPTCAALLQLLDIQYKSCNAPEVHHWWRKPPTRGVGIELARFAADG